MFLHVLIRTYTRGTGRHSGMHSLAENPEQGTILVGENVGTRLSPTQTDARQLLSIELVCVNRPIKLSYFPPLPHALADAIHFRPQQLAHIFKARHVQRGYGKCAPLLVHAIMENLDRTRSGQTR